MIHQNDVAVAMKQTSLQSNSRLERGSFHPQTPTRYTPVIERHLSLLRLVGAQPEGCDMGCLINTERIWREPIAPKAHQIKILRPFHLTIQFRQAFN